MASELRAVVDELGGEAVLGRRLERDSDLQTAIREGFPQKVIKELMEAADLSIKELAACLDLSPRSLQRRRREGGWPGMSRIAFTGWPESSHSRSHLSGAVTPRPDG